MHGRVRAACIGAQAELARSWRIEATVFYDRPPAHFRPASLAEKVRPGPCGFGEVQLG